MPDLKDVLYQMMEQSRQASQPTDLRVGTVTRVDPLEITTDTAAQPLRRSLLYLTQAVIEKKIPELAHRHTAGDSATGTALDSVACLENGAALPVQNGYIILNRALALGDRVLLLRVQNGQRFVVLSRIFEGG